VPPHGTASQLRLMQPAAASTCLTSPAHGTKACRGISPAGEHNLLTDLLPGCRRRSRHPMPFVQVKCPCCQRQRYEETSSLLEAQHPYELLGAAGAKLLAPGYYSNGGSNGNGGGSSSSGSSTAGSTAGSGGRAAGPQAAASSDADAEAGSSSSSSDEDGEAAVDGSAGGAAVVAAGGVPSSL
jgi:hypothetical protein